MNFLYRLGLILAYRLLWIYWFVCRPRTRGVNVAVWHRGRLLLIRNSYRRGLHLPGGNPKLRESEAEAAQRELAEEVDLHVTPGQLRPAGSFINRHEFKHDRVSFFECHLAAPLPVRIDQREVVWADFIPPQAIAPHDLSPCLEAYLTLFGNSAAHGIAG